MGLSSVESVRDTVDYNSNGFSFLSTVESLIGNREYSQPCLECIDGSNNSRTFYWKALSAVGDEISEAVYNNIRNYIQYVSDVDTCKIKALRSMLQLFNYNCTVLDNFMHMPIEVLKIMDILSIDKKYLKNAGFVRPELVSDMVSDGVFSEDASRLGKPYADFRLDFTNCTYQLATDANPVSGVSPAQMQWVYRDSKCVSSYLCMQFEYDVSGKISSAYIPESRLDELTACGYALSSIGLLSSLSGAVMYVNNKNYILVDDRQDDSTGTVYVHNGNMQRIFDMPADYEDIKFPGDAVSCAISSIYARISCLDTSSDYNVKWLSSNLEKNICVTLSNDEVQYDRVFLDDDKYQEYVKNIYKQLLYGYVTLPYNLCVNYMTHKKPVYIYPYLSNDYFDITNKYSSFSGYNYDDDGTNIDNQILGIKLQNHIQSSFDEKTIYDNIEAGTDSIDLYAGAELSVLKLEKSRREAPFNEEIPSIYSDSQVKLKSNQTRYSYYRRKKVLEYANFIDQYYAVSEYDKNASVYDFNSNYWQLDVSASNRVIRQTTLENANPLKDIDVSMIDTVAEHLAMSTQYVCKLRRELKLQTQKNYMRGTNLLLIYIINEYLRDYAKHNKMSADVLGSLDFEKISNNLENHSLQGDSADSYSINVREYYDSTEYFNIRSNSTASAQMSSDVNNRFWELTSFENQQMMKKDGDAFQLADIETFYLSSLELDRAVSGNLPAFLSAIYDLGANNTFIYSDNQNDLSIYSSVLSDGQFASDILPKLMKLSVAYTEFMNSYMSGTSYSYPDTTVIEQISDMLSTKVYPELSSEYLTGISSLHDTYKSQIDTISCDIGSLSSSYIRFVQDTYAYYYDKSTSKFCYSDHNPETGVYLYPYFNGNPEYDKQSDNLYSHLYQLKLYSTQSNIKNFALISTLTYVKDNITDISGYLYDDVISYLTSDCGFTDINSPTLDGQLQYTYDYVDKLITSRQEFLKSQLASLQTQSQSLKTQYDNLNNTFSNAVANFNDNNTGYKLGDKQVYWFSINSDSTGTAARKTDGKPPQLSKYEYVVYVNDSGIQAWYYGPVTSGTRYKQGTTTLKIPYQSDASLETRCSAVVEYMNAPTSKYNDSIVNYGLKQEGIVVVCDNIRAGLKDIRTSYSNVVEQAKSLFGIEEPQQTDIYSNILELIEKLTAVDDTSFVSDSKVQKYKKYFSRIVELSGQYTPVKSEYNRIFTDKAQTSYLANFSKQDDLTFESISELNLYITNTDNANYTEIVSGINKFINEDFQQIKTDIIQLQQQMEQDNIPGVVVKSGNDVESQIGIMYYDSTYGSGIVQDVINKRTIAVDAINDHKFKIYNKYDSGYLNIITAEISDDLDTTKKFTGCVASRLAQLNFFDHDIYNKYKDMFLTYGGRSFCYDPYYNLKNITHPSYQIHPYLWNFSKKLDWDTLIKSGFKSSVVDQLIESNVLQWINENTGIGKLGQTVNTWINCNDGLIDYSGYRSMYERGSNWSSKLNRIHEVIDYEGAFYPPALNEFRMYPDQSISSVSEQVTKSELYLKVCESLDQTFVKDISSYVAVNEDGTIQPSAQTEFSRIAQSVISDYVPYQMCTFNAKINDYIAESTVSTLTLTGIKTAAYQGLADTFYEKYYMQADIIDTEAVRIGSQLNEYKDRILELTDTKHEREQYDIYKYAIDINGTHYILYKQYDYTSLTEDDAVSYSKKRNTLGELWIRIKDHPIAFPAFSGTDPAYYIRQTSQLHPVIVTLARKASGDGIEYGNAEHTVINKINDKIRYIYDFEMPSNGASISYIVFDPNYSIKNKFYTQFKLAVVVSAPIDTYQDKDTGIRYLKFINKSSSSDSTAVDYIDFHANNTLNYTSDEDILNTNMLLKDGVRYPALVGYHLYDNNSISFVYTYYDFRASDNGTESFDDETQIYSGKSDYVSSFAIQVRDGTTYKKTPSGSATFDINVNSLGSRAIVGDSSCIGYNKSNGKLIFAYTTQLSSSTVKAETISGTIDMDKSSDGALFGDPMTAEMNSYDILQENITLIETKYKSKNIALVGIKDYNTNADISYIPVYAGYQNEFNMPSCYGMADSELCCNVIKSEYQNIELLGESKDISKYLDMVNPNPNPYFDYNTVKENVEFGRVYEDYKSEFEKTFTEFSNPSISFNSRVGRSGAHSIDVNEYNFKWSVKLNMLNATPFNIHDLKTAKVIIYNTTTIGKNPYYVGELWDFISERRLNYNDKLDDSNTADVSTSCDINNGTVTVTGTHCNINTHGKSDSNRIDRIKSITAVMNVNENALDETSITFTFEIDRFDPNSSFAKIPLNEIKVVIYNNKDLEIYQYYHMLDAYGAVQCKFFESLDVKSDSVSDNLGWGIYRVREGEPISSLTESFFIDKAGLKTYLKSIALSGYDSLSDVYVYRGTKMLSFKNEEKYDFPVSSDLYYYPTLNIKYPKKAANYVESNMSFATDTNTAVMNSMFSDKNLFVMQLEDANYIADKIGQVDIPIAYNDMNDIRVYEDYLSYDNNLSIYEYEKYDIGDARIAEYMHFTSDKSVTGSINVPDATWQSKTLDEFSETASISGLYGKTSEADDSSMVSQYVTINADRNTVDISKFLKFYVNYSKNTDSQSLDLYFNYFNYVDSPYVKIENGTQVKLDTISQTYLKLEPGQDGVLDIIIQFKYYIGAVLYGYKNIKVLSYHIYNISDDKPKFLMYKTYEVQRNQSKADTQKSMIRFRLDNIQVDLGEYEQKKSEKIKGSINIHTVSVGKLSEYDFYLNYPGNILNIGSQSGRGYYIDEEQSGLGLLHVKIDNPGVGNYSIPFETKYSAEYMDKYKNKKYSMSIDEAYVTNEQGEQCGIEFADSTILFADSDIDVIGTKDKNGTEGAYGATGIEKTVITI